MTVAERGHFSCGSAISEFQRVISRQVSQRCSFRDCFCPRDVLLRSHRLPIMQRVGAQFTLTGFNRIEGVEYAQSWLVARAWE